ncbi:MAG: hypothetical protein O2923_14630 [Verrucomicrobia bacterium]|nr:hypothetical protein [Verrucomicrobiota bacterium]MDA1088645.1 hypothetical protein [Verrucomicrobiota bacterium]
MQELGKLAGASGNVYFTGGATALLMNWRESTIDIDIKLDPEPKGVFSRIADLKDQLDINVELASPDHFIPELPGWRERSMFIARHGDISFFHYDCYSQALAKIERWHDRDRIDVQAMLAQGLVKKRKLAELFESIGPELIRYPAIDPESFRVRVERLTLEGSA